MEITDNPAPPNRAAPFGLAEMVESVISKGLQNMEMIVGRIATRK